MHRLGRLAIAASLAMAALLAGCGGSGESTTSATDSASPSAAASSAAPVPTTSIKVYEDLDANGQECPSETWMVDIQALNDAFGEQFARSQQDAGDSYCMSTYVSGDFYISVMAAWGYNAPAAYENDLSSGLYSVDNNIGEYALRMSDSLINVTGQAGVSVIDGEPTTATKYMQLFIYQGANADRQQRMLVLAQIVYMKMTQ